MGVLPLVARQWGDEYAYSFDDPHMNMTSTSNGSILNGSVDPHAISGLDSPTYYVVKWVVITSLCGTVFLWFTLGYIHAKHRVRQGKKPMRYHRFLLPAHLRTVTSSTPSSLPTQRNSRPRNRRALHRPAYGRDTWGGDPPPEYTRDRPPSYQPPPSYAVPPHGATKAAPDQRIVERDSEDDEVVESGSSSMRGTEMTTISVPATPAIPPPAALGSERP